MINKTNAISIISAIAFLSPLFSSGQDKKTPGLTLMQMHHETPGDAYLPNAYGNKKLSRAYKYQRSSAAKLTGSSIFTTQVNVASGGQNIIGDAANEPNIAVNPIDGSSMVIGWRQFDNVTSNFRQAGWSYTSDSGLTWTFPGVIEPGIFRSDPVLDYDTAGNFYYNSLTNTPDFFCKVFKSMNGGAVWDTGTAAAGGDKQWMAIDRTTGSGSGNIYSAWSANFSTCKPGFFTRSANGGNSFENCIEVDGYPFWGTETIDNAGNLYICGGDSTGSIVVSKTNNAQIPASVINWNLPSQIFMDGNLGYGATVNPGGLLGQVNIDIDRSSGSGQGNVYVLSSLTRISNLDPGDIMFAKSTDGGLTWSSPIKVNDDSSSANTQWLGTMSVSPNGRIDAVWLDTRDDLFGSDSSALYYSYSMDQGNTWSVNEKLSDNFDPHTGYPNQFKMGDYFDMISDNYGAHLAWANTLNGEEDVYYSHIIPPIVSGINETANNAVFSIFPNPTNGSFIFTNPTGKFHLEIFNLLGEKVFSKTSLQTKIDMDISAQPAGIYMLKIFNEDGSTCIQKIIKQ